MKIMKASVELMDRGPAESRAEFIERCGRVCYKSEDRIGPGTAEAFVRCIIHSRHESVLEHAWVTWLMGIDRLTKLGGDLALRWLPKFFTVTAIDRLAGLWVVSANIRALRDLLRFAPWAIPAGNLLPPEDEILLFGLPEAPFKQSNVVRPVDLIASPNTRPEHRAAHLRQTVRFVVDRGVSHELVRHRVLSFSQESTRYCDYDGGLSVVLPLWLADDLSPGEIDDIPSGISGGARQWLDQTLASESAYSDLRARGWSPQEARSVLPHSTKTEVVATGTIAQWREFLRLREASAAHSQMREVALPLGDLLRRRYTAEFAVLDEKEA